MRWLGSFWASRERPYGSRCLTRAPEDSNLNPSLLPRSQGHSGLALHDPRSTLHTPHTTHHALCPHPPTLEGKVQFPFSLPLPPSRRHGARTTGHHRVGAWRRLDSTWRMPHLRAAHATRADLGVHGACRPYSGAGPHPHPAQQSPLSPARRCEKCVLCACHHMCFHCALGALASGLSYHRAATLGENPKQRHTSPPTTATNACPYSCHTLVRAAQGMALRRVRGVRRLDTRLDLHLSRPSSAGRGSA